MSACISARGEYSSHDLNAEHECRRCFVLDEAALLDELVMLREALADAAARGARAERARIVDHLSAVAAEYRGTCDRMSAIVESRVPHDFNADDLTRYYAYAASWLSASVSVKKMPEVTP